MDFNVVERELVILTRRLLEQFWISNNTKGWCYWVGLSSQNVCIQILISDMIMSSSLKESN